MKSFKQYLNEADMSGVMWTDKVYNHIFSPGASDKNGNIKFNAVPITSKLQKEIFDDKIIIEAIHITSPKYFENLVKIQNSKKSISVTTLPINNFVGVHQMGVICKLKGNMLLASPSDIGSAPDEDGRRWIELYTILEHAPDSYISTEIQTYIIDEAREQNKKLHEEFVSKYGPYLEKIGKRIPLTWQGWPDILKIQLGEKILTEKDEKKIRKIMSLLIKRYIDMIQNILIKNKRLVQESLGNIKRASGKENIPGAFRGVYNEILMNEFKILGVCIYKRVNREDLNTDNVEYFEDLYGNKYDKKYNIIKVGDFVGNIQHDQLPKVRKFLKLNNKWN